MGTKKDFAENKQKKRSMPCERSGEEQKKALATKEESMLCLTS